MDYYRMTSPCGVDCFNCPIYLSGENEKLREAVAKYMNLPLEQVVCKGCRAEKGAPAVEGFTKACHVYECTEKKGTGFCCDCSDFPCDYLHPYADQASVRSHNTKVFNLVLIKKMGLEAWAKDKAKDVRKTYFKQKFKL